MVNPLTCVFHFFEAPNNAFEVQFFRTPFLHLIRNIDKHAGPCSSVVVLYTLLNN